MLRVQFNFVLPENFILKLEVAKRVRRNYVCSGVLVFMVLIGKNMFSEIE